METEIKRLRIKRRQLKAIITRIESFIKDPVALAAASKDMLQARKEKLVSTLKQYEEVSLDILSIDEKDGENISDVEEKYFQILSKLNETLGLLRNGESLASVSISNSKLPNIDICSFDGKDFTKFKSFMDLFLAVIDKNQSLSNVQKLFYLRKYVTDDALSLIINLPIENESYPIALELLNKRYDNRPRLVSNHINILLDLPQMQRGTAAIIRSFVSDIRQQLYALKNLNMPTDSWDMLLISILSRKLDSYTNRAYHLDKVDFDQMPTIDGFLTFLEKRAMALEDSPTLKGAPCYEGPRFKQSPKAINTVIKKACLFCNSMDHPIFLCPKFKMSTINERLNFVNLNKLCKICLREHSDKCKFNFKCKTCKHAHNSLLHEEKKDIVTLHSNRLLFNNVTSVLLPTIQVKIFDKYGQEFYVKALLDSGSQASIIKRSLVEQLYLSPISQTCNIIGVGNNNNQVSQIVNVTLSSLIENTQFQVKCHVVDSITTKLPQNYFDLSSLEIPKSVTLADVNFNVPSEISLLLGADLYFKTLLHGHIYLNNGLVLQNTLFGYIVGGSMACNNIKNDTTLVINHAVENEDKLSDIMEKFWLSEKVPEVTNKVNCEFQKAERIFKDTMSLKNCRFYVDLPLKTSLNMLHIGDTFTAALQRFYSLEKMFQAHPRYFNQYKCFIDEYISLGHAKIVDINDYDVYSDPVYFLAHHAVHNEHSKTTKLRVVFNGSLKSQCKISLNNVMLNGPIVQSELFDILVLFRTYRYTLMCDIEKMFRQIFINSIHTPLQNILWRDNPQKPIICLQLQTVTYGLKSSTYLATRCLLELAYIYKDRFPLAADAIIRNTYVDDIICGADNIDQLRNLKQELIQLLSLGSFTLHKWCSNNTQILEDIPSNRRYFEHININKDNMIKTLGLKYNILTDSFVFSCPAQDLKLLKTKREILSFIGKIYDPLGLIGPIIVTAKLFMQSLWSLKINWDEAIPSSLLDKWYKFGESLEKMNPINTQRGIVFGDTNNVELLGYCDASFDAIACCLYLRVFHRDGRVSVALLCSKSRVAPLKKTLTIPNLELNSALLLSQLTHKVNNTLKARFPLRTILHSDSQIVLAWLGNKNIKKNTYVSRRVREITDLTKDFTWTYVKGKDNPADLLSRGTAPHKLEESYMWFHGPQYLSDKYYEHIMYDYKSCVVTDSMPCDTLINSDKSVKKFCNVGQFDLSEDIFYRYSNFYKLRRIIALILRFKNNTQNPKNKLCGAITPKELCTSQVMIFRHIQEIHFHNEIKSLTLNKPVKSNLSSLHIFLDHQQLIRVGGRLDNTPNISYDKKHPIVLPKSDHVTHTLINSEHLRLLHAGAKLVLSSLSQAYWIVGGIREVKKVLHRCIGCFQIKAATAKQLMGSLPAERTTPARPFEVTGVDFCGPFEMKIARIRKPLITKAYIALFVCFSTKAIHLELISDLTTETFLACLRRFISRRGVPNRIYCDNAKTFKGASNYLTELYNLLASKHNMDSVHHFCSDKLINFKFIPSYAPEFGGLWEAGVKSVKYHLKRVVGFACLTFEELYTIITQIEAILNSRPLLPMSSDISDLTYLTPGHFLIGAPLTSIPEPNLSDININRLKFWQICTKIKQEFWKLWSNDYLTQLQNRPKWKYNYDNLKEGDLVIVKQVNVPSLYWPMGRIVKTFPGSDHKVRVAEVKMANGRTYVRSYQKLCPLPLVN